jgi:hypothetical protein
MNRFTFAGLVLFALLLVAPIASAQDGSPNCPWGYAYNPMTHDYVLVCLSQPTDNAAALKPAGLAKPAPVEQFVPCGYGERLDPLALACQSLSTSAAEAEAKPAPVEQFTPCGYGERLDPLALACLRQPIAAAKAAAKPAGLAAPAQAVIPEQGWPGCPWGYAYDLMGHGSVTACLNGPAAPKSIAPKVAGLAAPALVLEQPCGAGEHFDALLLMCLR